MTVVQLKNSLNQAANEKSSAQQAKLCRALLLDALQYIYEKAGEELPQQATALELLNSEVVRDYIGDDDIRHSLQFVRILGMNAEHGLHVRRRDVAVALRNVTYLDRKSTRLNSSHPTTSRMPSSA